MEEATDDFDVVDVYYFTSRSIDDALSESVSGEIYLFITACEGVAKSSKMFCKADSGLMQPSFSADVIRF